MAPAGIAATAWPRVEGTCRNIGWRFDPWQRAVGRLILAKRATGAWAADLSILSIPRQVGKTYLLGCIIFALCLLTPRLRVIWTSQHTATTEEMYEAMKELAAQKRVAPHMARRGQNGCVALQGSRWRIQFANGARIDFGARENGFGRGKSRVGVLVLDEFQHISMRALAALTPTTNTAENPLILCAGTPPTPKDHGEAFAMRRKAALDGMSDDTLFVEFSADRGCGIDDRKQWAKANPSFPKRTPERAFLLARKVLDDEHFRREYLGIWDDDDPGWAVFSSANWRACNKGTGRLTGTPSLALAVSPDLAFASISAANLRGQDVRGKLLAHGAGVAWVVGQAKALQDKHMSILVVDKSGPASSLIDELESAGVRLRLVSSADTADAEALLYQLVQERGTFRDASTPTLGGVLMEAARVAQWRPMGDRRVLDRKVGDITAVESVALAAWDAMANAYDVEDSFL